MTTPAYQIVENDVRLIRRALVALQLGREVDARTIVGHLRAKGLHLTMPDEQTPEQRARYLSRLQPNEILLAGMYGCVLLPDYNDAVFLNSKWRNPYTLYVRLVEDAPALGPELGGKYWIVSDLDTAKAQAERDHQTFVGRLKKWLRSIK